MKKTVCRVLEEEKTTAIYSKDNILKSNTFVSLLSKNLVIITDDNISKLFGTALNDFLLNRGFNAHIYSFKPGEKSKTRKTKESIEDYMLEKKLLRDTLILGVGGGVVTDLAGFVASTYMRSIPYISIPTSLLCAVDACIGGKTAVNTSFGKNQIGSFYQPEAIFIDPQIISSCPKNEMISGLAEIIKYGLINNRSLFEHLEVSKVSWEEKEPSFLENLIHVSQKEKIDVIQQDPKEARLRKVLNFGHTVGHAIEKSCDYDILHGEAISIGMIVESYLSLEMGFLSADEFQRIYDLFNLYNFPLKIPKTITARNLLEACAFDKKNTSQGVGVVLLSEIGKVKEFPSGFVKYFDSKKLEKLFNWTVEQFKPG